MVTRNLEDALLNATVVPDTECGYAAIPLETLDRVEELIGDIAGALYVGNTQKAMKILDSLKEEIARND